MKWKINTKLVVTTVLLFIIPMLFLGIINYGIAKAELDKKGQVILKNSVRTVIGMIAEKNKEVERGTITLEQGQEEIKNYILGEKKPNGTRPINKEIDLEENGYLIIYGQDGEEIAHPRIEGTNIWDVEDYSKTNYYFVRDIVKTANNGGGFTYYDWIYPNSDKIGEKINYGETEPNWGWIVNASAYVEDFNKSASNILVILIIVGIMSLMFGIPSILYFSKKISDPIEKLALNAKEISNGNLNISKVEVHGEDEVAVLTNTFNQMVDDINEYVREVKDKAEIQTLLKETELKALQSQVNPHFLFNALSVVVESALVEGADNTLEFTEEISKMLRYTLSSFHRNVRLEDELKMVGYYINLQSQRFGDRMTFETDYEADIKNPEMPSMTIQPMVENAIIHGLEGKVEGGKIKISVEMKTEQIIITVQDNGKGMSKERMEKIYDFENNRKHIGHTTGIGVNNVNERLKMFYGKDDLLIFDSEENVGTTVKIIIPTNN